MSNQAVKDIVAKIDGSEHLHGDLYRVPLSAIELVESVFEKSENLVFANPRHCGTSVQKPRGLSKTETDELRESIRLEGMKDPLVARPLEKDGAITLQLVVGERRKRSLDKIMSDNLECYCPTSHEMRPAAEVYSYVDCRIRIMDDEEALRWAFKDNELHSSIGEFQTVAFVSWLRDCGRSDHEIKAITGKSTTWIRDTDFLLKLDPDTYAAFEEGVVNRTVALQLCTIEDVSERKAVLEQAVEICQARLDAKKAKARQQADKASANHEIAEAQAAVASMTGADLDESHKNLENAKKKADRKKQLADEFSDKKPTVSSKDLSAATTGGIKALTLVKLRKHWMPKLSEAIKEEIEDVDQEDARLAKVLVEKQEAGETDILKILKHHFKAKQKRLGIA